MQSGEVNPSITTPKPTPEISQSQESKTLAPQIRTGFSNPMDFLNAAANEPVPFKTSQPEAPKVIDPRLVSEQIAKEVTPPPEPQPVKAEPPPSITPKFFEEEIPEEPKAETQEDPDEPPEEANPDRWKKFRSSYKETKKTLQALQTEHEVVKKKLQDFETGEIVPEVLKQKDEEIQRLSTYEKLVNLKGSKEYREKYVEPINAVTAKLKEIFADYGVPQEELERTVTRALNASNRVDLNRFLQDHLGNDELGAIEAKELVKRAKELQGQAAEAEREPAKALERLQVESDAVNQVREQTRRQKIVKEAESSWVDSLTEIRQEGKLVELIHRDNDPEFNQNFPDRLLPQAAKEYGKIVTELGKLGATDLPKPLAKALARMVLLSHASGVAIETRNRAMEHVETLSRNMTREHTLMRPPIGGGVGRASSGPVATQKLPSPEEEARSILQGVMTKR